MLTPGLVLGDKYRLVSHLGEGGMGSVWRAEHIALGRRLAIKFIRKSELRPETRARFDREARVAASIQHRNVIAITDYGTTLEGDPYIVMEHLEGESLRERFDRGPMDAAPLLDLAGGALAGLEAVHAAGIVHRDLKPENIFLAREADAAVPKILDFGISRRTDADIAAEPPHAITRSGALVGSPFYMSPEQARSVKDIDVRTDIWSMGVILYEGLAGRRPFDGDSLGQLLVTIATSDLPPLDVARPGLPAELVAVVHRATARNREERYGSARELREALLATLRTGAPDVAREVTPPATAAVEAAGAAAAMVDTSASTMASSLVAPRPAGRWPLAVGLIGLLALAVVAAMQAGSTPHGAPTVAPAPSAPPRPAPRPIAAPARVTVRLLDLPGQAEVRVDGDRHEGPVLKLERDLQSHRIEVTAPGTAGWRVEYVAGADADYRVVLPATTVEPPAAAASPDRKARDGRRRSGDGPPILGEPGF